MMSVVERRGVKSRGKKSPLAAGRILRSAPGMQQKQPSLRKYVCLGEVQRWFSSKKNPDAPSAARLLT
jgi:hypothetical protein